MGALFSGYLSCKELRGRERERKSQRECERERELVCCLCFGFFGGFCCFIVAKKTKKKIAFKVVCLVFGIYGVSRVLK